MPALPLNGDQAAQGHASGVLGRLVLVICLVSAPCVFWAWMVDVWRAGVLLCGERDLTLSHASTVCSNTRAAAAAFVPLCLLAVITGTATLSWCARRQCKWRSTAITPSVSPAADQQQRQPQRGMSDEETPLIPGPRSGASSPRRRFASDSDLLAEPPASGSRRGATSQPSTAGWVDAVLVYWDAAPWWGAPGGRPAAGQRPGSVQCAMFAGLHCLWCACFLWVVLGVGYAAFAPWSVPSSAPPVLVQLDSGRASFVPLQAQHPPPSGAGEVVCLQPLVWAEGANGGELPSDTRTAAWERVQAAWRAVSVPGLVEVLPPLPSGHAALHPSVRQDDASDDGVTQGGIRVEVGSAGARGSVPGHPVSPLDTPGELAQGVGGGHRFTAGTPDTLDLLSALAYHLDLPGGEVHAQAAGVRGGFTYPASPRPREWEHCTIVALVPSSTLPAGSPSTVQAALWQAVDILRSSAAHAVVPRPVDLLAVNGPGLHVFDASSPQLADAVNAALQGVGRQQHAFIRRHVHVGAFGANSAPVPVLPCLLWVLAGHLDSNSAQLRTLISALASAEGGQPRKGVSAPVPAAARVVMLPPRWLGGGMTGAMARGYRWAPWDAMVTLATPSTSAILLGGTLCAPHEGGYPRVVLPSSDHEGGVLALAALAAAVDTGSPALQAVPLASRTVNVRCQGGLAGSGEAAPGLCLARCAESPVSPLATLRMKYGADAPAAVEDAKRQVRRWWDGAAAEAAWLVAELGKWGPWWPVWAFRGVNWAAPQVL